MATKDSFPPDDRFPVFLSEDAGEIGQPDIGKAWDRAAIASQILKVSIFAAVATAIGIAILLVGNPVSLVADVTAAWTDKSEVQPGADPSTAATPSIAAAQDAPPATTDTPAREETAAVSEPAAQTRAEVDQPPSEDMFKQFQAWAAEADARTQAEPVKPAQDFAPVQAMQDAPQESRKKLRRRSSPRKSSGGPSLFIMREQRSGRSEMSGLDTAKSKAQRCRSRPYRTLEYRSRLCNLPRRRRSCKPSACAERIVNVVAPFG